MSIAGETLSLGRSYVIDTARKDGPRSEAVNCVSSIRVSTARVHCRVYTGRVHGRVYTGPCIQPLYVRYDRVYCSVNVAL